MCQLAELLADGVIEEICSPSAAPVVLVRKKGGEEWIFCMDYRRFDAVTIKDSHPLPRVDDTGRSCGLLLVQHIGLFERVLASGGGRMRQGEDCLFHWPRPIPVGVYAHGVDKLTCNIPTDDGTCPERLTLSDMYGLPRRYFDIQQHV